MPLVSLIDRNRILVGIALLLAAWATPFISLGVTIGIFAFSVIVFIAAWVVHRSPTRRKEEALAMPAGYPVLIVLAGLTMAIALIYRYILGGPLDTGGVNLPLVAVISLGAFRRMPERTEG